MRQESTDTHDLSTASRRKFLTAAGLAGASGLTGMAGCLGASGGGTPTINILAWASFEEVADQIEENVDANVEITGSTSAQEMFSQWNAGQNEEFDITMPNNNWVPRFIDAGLVAPLQEDQVPHWEEVYPAYQKLTRQQAGRDGEVYGVPQRFGWDSYAYDTRDVPADHDEDLELLFSDDYAGRIHMFDVFVKSMAHTALYLGYRDALEGEQFSLSGSQIQDVRDTLVEQKSMVSSYLGAPPDVKKSLSEGDSSLGLSWRFVVAQLQRDGNDWAEIAVPRQGALTWFEVAVVSAESDNKATAWQVVDTFINPEVIGEWLAGVGIASTNKNVADSLPGDQGAIIDIEPSRVENMVAYKTIENEDAWIEAWEEVKAA